MRGDVTELSLPKRFNMPKHIGQEVYGSHLEEKEGKLERHRQMQSSMRLSGLGIGQVDIMRFEDFPTAGHAGSLRVMAASGTAASDFQEVQMAHDSTRSTNMRVSTRQGLPHPMDTRVTPPGPRPGPPPLGRLPSAREHTPSATFSVCVDLGGPRAGVGFSSVAMR